MKNPSKSSIKPVRNAYIVKLRNNLLSLKINFISTWVNRARDIEVTIYFEINLRASTPPRDYDFDQLRTPRHHLAWISQTTPKIFAGINVLS